MGKAGKPARHVEVERKFDVPDAAAAPSFDGLSGVTRAERLPPRLLVAEYVDTPGYDLAAHRITLRRRTGGPDAGWHLKLPGAGEARTEIHAPLGPEAPGELLDTVAAVVRDRPLAPVARIETTREVTLLHGADGPLAEFCDDRVSACRVTPAGTEAPQAWREWELELCDPAAGTALLDRLGSRLRDAGAAPAGHAAKLARALGDALPPAPAPPADPVHRAVAAQVARLLEWDRAVRADAEDAVHQMRVATRQIRSLLQSSEEAFGIDDGAWILRELRELAAVLGTARDAEVLAERYRAALGELDPDLVRGPVAERLVEGARHRYRTGLARSLRAMRSARYFRLLDALDSLAAGAPAPAETGRPAPASSSGSSLSSSYRKVRKAVRAAGRAASGPDSDVRDHALHRIRKAAKRLRYIAAATGRSGVEQRSKAVQTLLGEHQDSVVSREHLLRTAAAAHAAGEDTFTYGVLYQREADLAQRCRDELDAALGALRRSVGKAR